MSTVRIQLRRGTEQEWIDADAIGLGVVLAPGEAGIETDTNRFKFGNGNDKWGELLYANASNTGNTLDDYILTSARGNPSGVASLDSNGLVPVAQLPASVKVTVSSVADQAARLALTAEPGDIAIQTDSGASYVLQTAGASTDANWKELVGNEKVQDVIGAMLSGNTETGITVTYEDSDGTIDFVVADQFSTHSTSDLSEGTNLYFTNERAVDALDNELSLKAPLTSPAFIGIPTAETASPGTNNTQIATTAYADAAVAAIIDSAPGALNTLNEIAAAINDDANFSGTIVGIVSNLESDFLGHSGSPSAHGSQGDIVGLQNTQTLTNKTMSGTSNTFSNIPQSAITDLNTTLSLYATAHNPTFTGTATGLTKASVGLGDVDNTPDSGKPISTPTQSALDLKADIVDLDLKAPSASPTFTGTVILPSTTSIGDTTALEIAKLHDITATAAELNTLDGVTATTAELNVLDGITASTSELNILDGVTAAFSEINVLDGITSTTAELNILNGVTSNAAELNILDGALATTAEINYLSGVTSAIQTQLNAKANSADITEAAQDAVGDVVGNGLVYDDTTGKIEPSLEVAGGLKFAPITNKLAADLDYIVDKTAIQTLTNKTLTSPKINEDVAVTATATELNILDGATLSTAELNYVDGVTSSIQTQLNGKQSIVDNVSDVEIGYLDGVTSGIQGQLDAKFNTADASTTNISEGTNLYFTEERAQDAIGNNIGVGLSYNDTTGGIALNFVTTGDTLLDGVSGASYGLIGTSAYLDVKNTNGYNKEIELDIAAVKSTLDTDGYITTASTSTLTNKTLTSPKINENVALTATSTELNYVDGVTSAIQTQIDSKINLAGGTMTGALTLSGAPTSDLHAATKLYVDNVTAGINFHEAVHAATTTNLTADYANGTNGVGATLMATANGAWTTLDGHSSFTQYDRILVKDQTDTKQNGIYVLSDLGSSTSKWVLTRASDADNNPSGEMEKGDFVLVINGTTNSSYGFVNNSISSPIVIGTDAITYSPFNAGKTVSAGNGLSETSPGVFAIDTTVTQTRVSNVSDTEIGYLDGVTSAIQTQLDAKETRYYTFVTDTTTARTVTASTDEGKTLKFTSSSPITVTVPTAANDAGWAVGDYVEIIQYGSGQITVAGAVGVTVNATDSQKKTRVQFSSLTLIKVAANEWLLTGDTTA